MSFKIPERIETERLILRTFRDEDWRDLHAYYSDAECMRYTLGRSLTEGETWRSMAGMIGHWQLRGFGPYAVQSKQLDRVLGPVGLWFPNDWPSPEIEWGLAREFWGQGYAAEAARAVKAMADETMPEVWLISLIFSDNEASIRLAEAVGASFERGIEFRGKACSIYRHERAGGPAGEGAG